MNITKVEQKTIRDSKAEVANLAWLYEQEQDPAAKEQIGIVLENARFWHDIAESAILNPVIKVKEKPKRRIKRLVYAVNIAVILTLLYLVCTGCRSTLTGCGMMLQGGAHIVKGTGDYLVAEGTDK